MKIAILGATGHIAKGLIHSFVTQSDVQLELFARNLPALQEFLQTEHISQNYRILEFADFGMQYYDAVINCIGSATPSAFNQLQSNVLLLTEYYDNLVLSYLSQNPQCLYINFSSGAVYGSNCGQPVNSESESRLPVNSLSVKESYAVAKINAEMKHRALPDLNIVDLRVFSYFSRFIDLDSGYLITDLMQAVLQNKVFKTTGADIVRDYVSPQEIYQLVQLCLQAGQINDAFDVYSLSPVTKFEMINLFIKRYNLKLEISDSLQILSTGNNKNSYYTENRKAYEQLGYQPGRSSIQIIEEESPKILDVLI